MKKKLLAIVLAAAMAVTLTACGGNAAAPQDQAGAAGTESAQAASTGSEDTEAGQQAAQGKILDNGRYEKLVVAIAADPQDLEGDDVNVEPRYYWIYGVYESLFDFADDGSRELHPCLAKSYEAAEDGMSWTISLNEDIHDWDGNPITASDVKFCFEKIITDGQAIRFDFFDSIEVIDDYTFKMHFTAVPPAIAELEFPLARTLIFSEKAFADHNGMTTEPCGTGCYKVTEFVAGSKVVMEANDDYWGLSHEELQPRHKATVQTLELQVVPEAATAVVGLETGTLDVCSYVPLSMEEEFKTGQYADRYSVEEIQQGDYWYIAPNCQALNEDLRKAIFYAIDNEALCTAMGGQFVPATTFGNSAYADYDPSLEATGTYLTDYDVEKAKEYLAASGYNGETLRLTCINNEVPTKAAQMIQVLLQQVGVTIEINAVTVDMYNTITSAAHADEWDLMLNQVGGPSMVGSWHLTMDNEVNDGLTMTMVDDPKLQELYEAATADATHDAAHMKETIDYVTDNAYLYVVSSIKTALVYPKTVESMYYREGYYTPGAAAFKGQE